MMIPTEKISDSGLDRSPLIRWSFKNKNHKLISLDVCKNKPAYLRTEQSMDVHFTTAGGHLGFRMLPGIAKA